MEVRFSMAVTRGPSLWVFPFAVSLSLSVLGPLEPGNLMALSIPKIPKCVHLQTLGAGLQMNSWSKWLNLVWHVSFQEGIFIYSFQNVVFLSLFKYLA